VRVFGRLLVQASGAESVSLGVPVPTPRQPAMRITRSERCLSQVPRITSHQYRVDERGSAGDSGRSAPGYPDVIFGHQRLAPNQGIGVALSSGRTRGGTVGCPVCRGRLNSEPVWSGRSVDRGSVFSRRRYRAGWQNSRTLWSPTRRDRAAGPHLRRRVAEARGCGWIRLRRARRGAPSPRPPRNCLFQERRSPSAVPGGCQRRRPRAPRPDARRAVIGCIENSPRSEAQRGLVDRRWRCTTFSRPAHGSDGRVQRCRGCGR
jgi:hypothetical protein